MDEGKKAKIKRILLLCSGLAIGAANGLLGGGGGMITVPALHYFGGLPAKKAHATAIAVMLPLCVLSAVTYTIGGVYHVTWGLISGATITVGGALGAVILSRLKNSGTALLFYTLMTGAGIWSVVKCFG